MVLSFWYVQYHEYLFEKVRIYRFLNIGLQEDIQNKKVITLWIFFKVFKLYIAPEAMPKNLTPYCIVDKKMFSVCCTTHLSMNDFNDFTTCIQYHSTKGYSSFKVHKPRVFVFKPRVKSSKITFLIGIVWQVFFNRLLRSLCLLVVGW